MLRNFARSGVVVVKTVQFLKRQNISSYQGAGVGMIILYSDVVDGERGGSPYGPSQYVVIYKRPLFLPAAPMTNVRIEFPIPELDVSSG